MKLTRCQVKEYMVSAGLKTAGYVGCADRVVVDRCGPVFIVKVEGEGGCGKYVVKSMDDRVLIRQPGKLQYINETLRGGDVELHERMVGVVGHDAAKDLLIMEYVSGPTLMKLMFRAFRGSQVAGEVVVKSLGRMAYAQAAIHRYRASDVGLDQAVVLNRTYMPAVEQCFNDVLIGRCLPKGIDGFGLVVSALGGGFADRVGDRVFRVDFQPKNVLVCSEHGPRMIDPDYACGNPALAVGHFLHSLDRIGLRWPTVRGFEMVQGWKRVFWESYQKYGEAKFVKDITFFYPWALLRGMRSHVRSHRVMGRFLLKVYGRYLRAYLTEIECGNAVVKWTA